MTEKKNPGPKPETVKIPLPFEEAVKAALETKVTDKPATKRRKRSRRLES